MKSRMFAHAGHAGLLVVAMMLFACQVGDGAGEDRAAIAVEVNAEVSIASSAVALLEPDSAEWSAIPEYRVELQPAPPVHPSISLRHDADAESRFLYFRVARNEEHVFIRLRWADDSANATTRLNEYSDAVAVQFAIGSGAATSEMLGTPDAPVNIWYWKAAGNEAQNLAAGGFGSTTQLPLGELRSSSRSADVNGGQEWVVVLARPLSGAGEYDVEFATQSLQAAFALWQGANQERDGLKHTSAGWITLR